MELRHTADREGKLLSFLRTELRLSASLVKRLKWQNAFLVDGTPVHTDCKVLPGQRITVLLDETATGYPAEDAPLHILYEDDALIAIDKPPGLLMHPSFYRNSGTLANFLLGYYQKTGQSCAVHPVSRLDRDTFGVVLFAKNAHIHAQMMQALKAHTFEKTYHALVYGTPPQEGRWSFPIARCEGESLLREVRQDGQSAETVFRRLEQGDDAAKLELSPITGRTHQLRVHCAHAGFPILGDRQYGTEASLACRSVPHQQLCAVRLRFTHPVTKDMIHIESDQEVYL
ncbi:MAG: RluA family pseudouridine synthase [Oscillospiraceae bacterium]|nr:RluA family pseudouridine synthase [Oscillospiraceae bacterium]